MMLIWSNGLKCTAGKPNLALCGKFRKLGHLLCIAFILDLRSPNNKSDTIFLCFPMLSSAKIFSLKGSEYRLITLSFLYIMFKIM